MRHRERKNPATLRTLGQVYYRLKPNGAWLPYNIPFTNASKIGANGFPNALSQHCYDVLHNGPPYTEGGPFNLWEFETTCTSPRGTNVYAGNSATYEWRYMGGFIPSLAPANNWFGPDVSSFYKDIGNPTNCPGGLHPWGDVSSYGPDAWAKFRPGKNSADAGIFLGEIRDLPRMLKTTARAWRDAYVSRFGKRPKAAAKKAADHWLNTQFGWLPFISDLRKFYKTYEKLDRILAFLRRNNGKWIKRGGAVMSDEGEWEVLASYNDERIYPQLLSYFFPAYPSRGGSRFLRKTDLEVWFEARMRYFIPNIDSVEWSKQATRALFGLELTPSLVWELLPWSWLVDWFSNVGEVLATVSGTGPVQNLVAKYAYVMGTKVTRVRLESVAKLSPPVTLTWDWRISRKSRVEANPFGFGVTWESLSPRQWSILGALGITRLR